MKFETKIFDEPHLEFGDKHHTPTRVSGFSRRDHYKSQRAMW